MKNVVVLGADGWLGGLLARRLGARSVAFGQPYENWLARPDGEIVINCTGWRVRPGLLAADYFRSHVEVARRLTESLGSGQTLIHLSSASVFGRGRRPSQPVDPASFPCRPYAVAKFAAEDVVTRAAESGKFRAIILRPAILYAPGGEGMIGTLVKQAARGVLLRVLPAGSRHHLCSDRLLEETIARLAAAPEAFAGRRLVVADPFVLTNAAIFSDLASLHPGRPWPLPAEQLSTLLRPFPRLRPFDLRTWGEILAIWALDSTYDAAWLWSELGLDPGAFDKEKRWRETLATPATS